MKELLWTERDMGWNDYVIDNGIELIDEDKGFYSSSRGTWLKVY